jgi:hypothetical protein
MLARTTSAEVREAARERFDGHLVDISHHSGPTSGGVSVRLDVSAAPVPPRRYEAEVGAVSLIDGHLRLVFGQSVLGAEEELDSALVIRLAPEAAHSFVAMIFAMSNPGLEAIARITGARTEPLLSTVPRPAQVARLAANMAAVGVSGFESCIDFYHASPFVMRNIETKKQIGVEPVVRITLSTGLFLSLALEARTLVAQLPDLTPAGDTP